MALLIDEEKAGRIGEILAGIAGAQLSVAEAKFLRRTAVIAAASSVAPPLAASSPMDSILFLFEDLLSRAAGVLGPSVGLGQVRKALLARGQGGLARRLSVLAKARAATAHPDVALPAAVEAALLDAVVCQESDSPAADSDSDCCPVARHALCLAELAVKRLGVLLDHSSCGPPVADVLVHFDISDEASGGPLFEVGDAYELLSAAELAVAAELAAVFSVEELGGVEEIVPSGTKKSLCRGDCALGHGGGPPGGDCRGDCALRHESAPRGASVEEIVPSGTKKSLCRGDCALGHGGGPPGGDCRGDCALRHECAPRGASVEVIVPSGKKESVAGSPATRMEIGVAHVDERVGGDYCRVVVRVQWLNEVLFSAKPIDGYAVAAMVGMGLDRAEELFMELVEKSGSIRNPSGFLKAAARRQGRYRTI
jgi:hypothetical protein